MDKLTYKELEAELEAAIKWRDIYEKYMHKYEELRAENARLREKILGYNRMVGELLDERTEDRYWAIHYKQLYDAIHPEYIILKLSLLPDEPDI